LLLLYDDNFNYLNNNSCICKGGLVSLHSHLKEKLYKRCEKFMEKFIPRIFKNEIIRQEKEEFVNNNKVYTLDLEEKTYGFDDKNNLIRVFLSNIIYKKIEIDMVKYTNKFKNSTFCKQKRKSEYCSYIISNNETAKLIKMNNLIKDFFIYEESYTIVKNFINWYFYKKLKPELLLFLKNNNIHKNKGI